MMKWRRELIVVGAVAIVVILIIGLLIGNSVSSSQSTRPAGATPVPAGTVPAAVPTRVPVLIACTLRGGQAAHTGRGAVGLAELPVACGCVKVIGPGHRATWRHHTLGRGVRFTGACPGAVFRLQKRYSRLSGHIYVDDATGTMGGVITVYNAIDPANSSTYRQLFSTDIGYLPRHDMPLAISIRGVENLAIVERCCTVQNTVFDVVATVTPMTHRSR